MANIEQKVEELLSQKVESLGYSLYDVEYVKEGKDFFLRIYIDSSKGITLEDCELVSNNITDILDKEDYIKEQYFLEVSSPGVERVLKKDKHLELNINSEVSVKLFKPVDGEKQFQGTLENFNEENIVLGINGENVELSRKNISQIKTVYNW